MEPPVVEHNMHLLHRQELITNVSPDALEVLKKTFSGSVVLPLALCRLHGLCDGVAHGLPLLATPLPPAVRSWGSPGQGSAHHRGGARRSASIHRALGMLPPRVRGLGSRVLGWAILQIEDGSVKSVTLVCEYQR